VQRVLLVDDDRQFRQALTRDLLRHGYRVEEAEDGLDAIDKAVLDPPDLAVVDLVMPRIGGREIVALFRQNPFLASIPVVVLSGVLAESLSTLTAIGADCVLAKGPLEATSRLLLSALETLSQRPAMPEAADRSISSPLGLRPRRQVAELLRINQDLGAVLEHAAVGLLELDPRGRIFAVNTRAEEMLGIGRASLIGVSVLSVLPKAGLGNLRVLLSRFDADPGPASRSMTTSLEHRRIQLTLTSVWRDGARQSIVATLVEIAVDDDAEDRPLRLLQYLSHEMRASLLMIEGSLRSLATAAGSEDADLAPRDDSGPSLPFLAQEVGRLLRLLGDATKFHRTLRELPTIELEPIDLVGVLKDSISGIGALAIPQGIEVSFRGPSVSPKVQGHQDKLVQVLYNLLLNALKSTSPGGAVWVELAVADTHVATTIADTGHGLAPDELRTIMAQAQRAELFLPQKGKRVGLGLAIAYQIVRAHRGQLSAESQPGVGSRFTFTLPVSGELVLEHEPVRQGVAPR
jgi:PAS domain S-box-containing protein